MKLRKLGEVARALGVDTSQLSQEAKRRGFPLEEISGERFADVELVRAWRKRNIRPRRGGLHGAIAGGVADIEAVPAVADPATGPGEAGAGSVSWETIYAFDAADFADDGKLSASKVYGELSRYLTVEDFAELAKWATLEICRRATEAAQALFGRAEIPERAPLELYQSLLAFHGEGAIAQTLTDVAWKFARLRFGDDSRWAGFFAE